MKEDPMDKAAAQLKGILDSLSPKACAERIAHHETSDLLSDVCELIESAQGAAQDAVDALLVLRSWLLGRRLAGSCLDEGGKADPSSSSLQLLAAELTEKFGKGFDSSSLCQYARFCQEFPEILDSLSPKSGRPLSWTHYRLLLQEPSAKARAWHEKEARAQAWSARTLQRSLSARCCCGLQPCGKEPAAKAQQELAAPCQAGRLEFARNPAAARFLGLEPGSTSAEGGLDQRLAAHIQKFFLEMGKGYALAARKQPLRTGNEECFADLVFYNFILKCFVLVDLKTAKRTPKDDSKMERCIRLYDDTKRSDGDNPTVGVIVCSDADEDAAKCFIAPGHEQLLASQYKACLPSEGAAFAQLRAEIEVQKLFHRMQEKEGKPGS